MCHKTNQYTELRKYLLGLVKPASQRECFEQRLMTDDEYFELLLITEESLIQDYVDGDLSQCEQIAFNRHFQITEERQWKITFSRALRLCVNMETTSTNQNRKIA